MGIQVSSPSAPRQTDGAQSDRTTYLQNLLDQRLSFGGAESGASSDSDLSSEWTAGLQALRDRAADEVRSLSIPSTRDEEWRFTDLAPLLNTEFQTPTSESIQLRPTDLETYQLPEASQSRLVFVDGQYAPALSVTDQIPSDVRIANLTDPKMRSTHLMAYLDKQEGLERTFTTLNTASFVDAAVVWIPKNVVVETPIHLLFLSTAGAVPVASHPRCLVVAEPNSAVTLIEEYGAVEDGAVEDGVYFTNAVTEIWADENARIDHTRLQRDRHTAFHIGKTAVSQARTSHYTCHAISLGARLSRHNLEVFQHGEETETILNGLTLVTGEQLADTHSLTAYTRPYGRSRQLHKCIVGDRARAVFNGKVNVPQAAQLTDAGQLNRNLLLSPKGRVDTKPQLEIVADNVKCTHGATVSQLDADEVFYLQSRGIDAHQAQTLLIYAFAAEILQRLPIPSLQETLSQAVNRLTSL